MINMKKALVNSFRKNNNFKSREQQGLRLYEVKYLSRETGDIEIDFIEAKSFNEAKSKVDGYAISRL